MTPQATAIVDQARAAQQHGWREFHATASRMGSRVYAATMTGPRGAIVRRYLDLAVAGRISFCPHLSPRAPQPMTWCAWAPARVGCAPCGQLSNLAVNGTEEDKRCDHCRALRSTIYACQVWLPATALPALGLATGPTQLQFGLCPPCFSASNNPLRATETAEQGTSRGTGRARRGSRGRGRGRGAR